MVSVVYVYAEDVIQFHQLLLVGCLRWRRHNHHHCVCVQSNCEQVCALRWSASCVVELWVGNCRWHQQHKHTLPHRHLKVKSVPGEGFGSWPEMQVTLVKISWMLEFFFFLVLYPGQNNLQSPFLNENNNFARADQCCKNCLAY